LLATSNLGKIKEAKEILSHYGMSVEQFNGKGTEIQADTNGEVAAYASRGAAFSAGEPVLVEDAGLYVRSLRGFPGPYSAYVFKTIGVAGIISLIGEGRAKGRAARFESSVAYCEPGGEPRLFDGSVAGTISSEPRGDRGFGFDPIFVPTGSARTFGELTLREKCAVSHRAAAMRKFAEWYLSRAPG